MFTHQKITIKTKVAEQVKPKPSMVMVIPFKRSSKNLKPHFPWKPVVDQIARETHAPLTEPRIRATFDTPRRSGGFFRKYHCLLTLVG